MRKIIALGIVLLFLGMTISSSTGINLEKKSVKPLSSGDTLYVGGNGTGNYSKIQDAIDNASDGDTVYVYDDSSPYYENVRVNKSINLIGEDKETTIIDGNSSGDVVYVSVDWVNISGFTVLGKFIVEANFTIISDNIIKSHWDCIQIGSFSGNLSYYNNTIMNNAFKSDGYICIVIFNTILNIISGNIINSGIIGGCGILLHNSNNSVVSENIIKDSEIGIFLDICNNNTITKNTISICRFGVYLGGYQGHCSFNTISKNSISANNFSICLDSASSNKIFENNFLDNERGASFITSFLNQWKQNYWNRPRILPKLIFGVIEIGSIWLPWINIDWHPAQEPYDIGV